MASDREVLTAMLDRARIGWRFSDPSKAAHWVPNGVPADATSVLVGEPPGPNLPQPLDSGGYRGFFTEIVFDTEGGLLAVWSWE